MSIRVALHHRTSYDYDRPVRLGPQVVRLRPAPQTRTAIVSYSLRVESDGEQPNVGVNDLPVELEHFVRDEHVAIGTWREDLRNGAAHDDLNLGFPAIFEPDHIAHAKGFARMQKPEARVAKIAEDAEAAPTLIQDEMLGVVLACWRKPIVDRRSNAD